MDVYYDCRVKHENVNALFGAMAKEPNGTVLALNANGFWDSREAAVKPKEELLTDMQTRLAAIPQNRVFDFVFYLDVPPTIGTSRDYPSLDEFKRVNRYKIIKEALEPYTRSFSVVCTSADHLRVVMDDASRALPKFIEIDVQDRSLWNLELKDKELFGLIKMRRRTMRVILRNIRSVLPESVRLLGFWLQPYVRVLILHDCHISSRLVTSVVAKWAPQLVSFFVHSDDYYRYDNATEYAELKAQIEIMRPKLRALSVGAVLFQVADWKPFPELRYLSVTRFSDAQYAPNELEWCGPLVSDLRVKYVKLNTAPAIDEMTNCVARLPDLKTLHLEGSFRLRDEALTQDMLDALGRLEDTIREKTSLQVLRLQHNDFGTHFVPFLQRALRVEPARPLNVLDLRDSIGSSRSNWKEPGCMDVWRSVCRTLNGRKAVNHVLLSEGYTFRPENEEDFLLLATPSRMRYVLAPDFGDATVQRVKNAQALHVLLQRNRSVPRDVANKINSYLEG